MRRPSPTATPPVAAPATARAALVWFLLAPATGDSFGDVPQDAAGQLVYEKNVRDSGDGAPISSRATVLHLNPISSTRLPRR